MTYTGAPCGAHLSEFDVDRSSDGNGESRSAYTPKVVCRWEIGAPKRFDCADFMEPPSKLLANGHLTSVVVGSVARPLRRKRQCRSSGIGAGIAPRLVAAVCVYDNCACPK
jgi:hypothetical protein